MRYRDFVAHAFGRPLVKGQTQGYYNTAAASVAARLAAQTLRIRCTAGHSDPDAPRGANETCRVYGHVFGCVDIRRTDLETLGIAARFFLASSCCRAGCAWSGSGKSLKRRSSGCANSFAARRTWRWRLTRSSVATSGPRPWPALCCRQEFLRNAKSPRIKSGLKCVNPSSVAILGPSSWTRGAREEVPKVSLGAPDVPYVARLGHSGYRGGVAT